MILGNYDFITSKEDIPNVVSRLKQVMWFDKVVGKNNFGEIAKAQYVKNLEDSIGEAYGTHLVIDPFLKTLGSVFGSIAETARSSEIYPLQRGFFRHHPSIPADIHKEASPLDYVEEKEAAVLRLPELHNLKNKTVPSHVKLSRKLVYSSSLFEKSRIYAELIQYGVSKEVTVALCQGRSIEVSKEIQYLKNYDFSNSIRIFINNSYFVVPSKYLEPVYTKVRTDEEMHKLLFAAKTHVGKYIQVEEIGRACEIIEAYNDKSNNVILLTEETYARLYSRETSIVKMPPKFIVGMPVIIKNRPKRLKNFKIYKIASIHIVKNTAQVKITTPKWQFMFNVEDLRVPKYSKQRFKAKHKKGLGTTESFWQKHLKSKNTDYIPF